VIGKSILYRLLWAIWLLIAAAAFVLSFWLLGEPPFWPNPSNESTIEGWAVWAVLAAIFYGTPLYLLAVRNIGRKENS